MRDTISHRRDHDRRNVQLVYGSLPQATGEPLGPGSIDRRFDCRRYRNCLDFADDQRWAGFHCACCPVREPRLAVEMRDDLVGLAELLEEIMGGDA